jgi:hypothetical protein
MRVSGIVATAVAATGIGYAVHAYRPSPAPAKAHAASESEMGALERPAERPNDSAELAELRHQVAKLGAQVEALRAPAPPAAVKPEEAPDPTDPQAEARVREERRAHIADLEAQFVAEPRDAGWSSTTHHAIVEALDANELRDAAASMDCRTHTCRVEVADRGPETNGMLLRAARQVGSTLPTVEWDHVDHGNGRRSKVLYLSRPVAGGQ